MRYFCTLSVLAQKPKDMQSRFQFNRINEAKGEWMRERY